MNNMLDYSNKHVYIYKYIGIMMGWGGSCSEDRFIR